MSADSPVKGIGLGSAKPLGATSERLNTLKDTINRNVALMAQKGDGSTEQGKDTVRVDDASRASKLETFALPNTTPVKLNAMANRRGVLIQYQGNDVLIVKTQQYGFGFNLYGQGAEITLPFGPEVDIWFEWYNPTDVVATFCVIQY